MIWIFAAIHIFLVFIFWHVLVIDVTFVVFQTVLILHGADLVPAFLRASDNRLWNILFRCRFFYPETLLILKVGFFNFSQTFLAHHFLILFKFASESTWSYVLEVCKRLLFTVLFTCAYNWCHTRRMRVTTRLEFLSLIYSVHLVLSNLDFHTCTAQKDLLRFLK